MSAHADLKDNNIIERGCWIYSLGGGGEGKCPVGFIFAQYHYLPEMGCIDLG